MKTVGRTLAILLFTFSLLSTLRAQSTVPTRPPAERPCPVGQMSAAGLLVTATAWTAHVRYASMGEVHQTRLQVFSAAGAQVYDSGLRLGNVIDW